MPTHYDISPARETLAQHWMHSHPFFQLCCLFRAGSEKRPSCKLQNIGSKEEMGVPLRIKWRVSRRRESCFFPLGVAGAEVLTCALWSPEIFWSCLSGCQQSEPVGLRSPSPLQPDRLRSHTSCRCSVARSCVTLCDPVHCSAPGLSDPHHSRSLPKFVSIASVMPSSRLILCHPLLLPSVFPSIRDLSNESAVRIRWPKYWSFNFSISPSNQYSGLISLRIDWLDLLAVQGTFGSILQYHNLKASTLWCLPSYSSALTTVRDHWEDHSLDLHILLIRISLHFYFLNLFCYQNFLKIIALFHPFCHSNSVRHRLD